MNYTPTNFPSVRPKKSAPLGKKRTTPVLNGNLNNTASNLWEIHQKIFGSIGVITRELETVKTLADEILALINQSDPEFLHRVRNVKGTKNTPNSQIQTKKIVQKQQEIEVIFSPSPNFQTLATAVEMPIVQLQPKNTVPERNCNSANRTSDSNPLSPNSQDIYAAIFSDLGSPTSPLIPTSPSSSAIVPKNTVPERNYNSANQTSDSNPLSPNSQDIYAAIFSDLSSQRFPTSPLIPTSPSSSAIVIPTNQAYNNNLPTFPCNPAILTSETFTPLTQKSSTTNHYHNSTMFFQDREFIDFVVKTNYDYLPERFVVTGKQEKTLVYAHDKNQSFAILPKKRFTSVDVKLSLDKEENSKYVIIKNEKLTELQKCLIGLSLDWNNTVSNQEIIDAFLNKYSKQTSTLPPPKKKKNQNYNTLHSQKTNLSS